MTARNSYITEANSDEKREFPSDEKAKAMLDLAKNLCQFLLDDAEVLSEDSSAGLEQETSAFLEKQGDLNRSNLSNMSDVLDPYQCHLLLEHCKPLIALKIVRFQIRPDGTQQVGEISWQSEKQQ